MATQRGLKWISPGKYRNAQGQTVGPDGLPIRGVPTGPARSQPAPVNPTSSIAQAVAAAKPALMPQQNVPKPLPAPLMPGDLLPQGPAPSGGINPNASGQAAPMKPGGLSTPGPVWGAGGVDPTRQTFAPTQTGVQTAPQQPNGSMGGAMMPTGNPNIPGGGLNPNASGTGAPVPPAGTRLSPGIYADGKGGTYQSPDGKLTPQAMSMAQTAMNYKIGGVAP